MSQKWYSPGFSEAHQIQEMKDTGVYNFGNNHKSRFGLKAGTEKTIIFLDDFSWKVKMGDKEKALLPFCINEHRLQLNGDWMNTIYLTCARGSVPCIACGQGFKKSYVGIMSILDITPFEDKKTGEMITRPQKRLVAASPSVLVLLETKQKKRDNLMGWKCSVSRHQKKSPRVGEDFDFDEQFTFEQLKKQFEGINLDPLGFTQEQAFEYYVELMKPLSENEQKSIFDSSNVTDGNDYVPDKKFSASASASGSGNSSDNSDNDLVAY